MPTKFMVGTERGTVISGNRKAKTNADKIAAQFRYFTNINSEIQTKLSSAVIWVQFIIFREIHNFQKYFLRLVIGLLEYGVKISRMLQSYHLRYDSYRMSLDSFLAHKLILYFRQNKLMLLMVAGHQLGREYFSRLKPMELWTFMI